MSRKGLQGLVCFAMNRKEPTLDELDDRAKTLEQIGRLWLGFIVAIAAISLWGLL